MVFNTMSEIRRLIPVPFRVERPDCPCSPTSEWYCQNSDCDVREVTIEEKHYGHNKERVKPMKCPRCGRDMAHTGYVEHRYLEPTPAEGSHAQST